MAARVKKRTDTATNRESDKIIVRLPNGMRARIAELAASRGRSMNAEVVAALNFYIEHGGSVEAIANRLTNRLKEKREEANRPLMDEVHALKTRLATLEERLDNRSISAPRKEDPPG